MPTLARDGDPVGHCGSQVGLSGELPSRPCLAGDARGPGLAATVLLSLWGCSRFSFLGCSSAPVSRGCVAGWEQREQCQALCGVIQQESQPFPCHVLPAQCMCHISSPGPWRPEGAAGNHSGMQSGASKESLAATFPPLCCAFYSRRHLCLSWAVSPKEERDGVFGVVMALSPPDRSQGHGGPGERL